MTKRYMKKRRAAARVASREAIKALSEEELRNMSFELGREYNQQAVLLNEIRARHDAVKIELEMRRTATASGINISDHAVVRYLERHKGLNVGAIREEIVAIAKRVGNPDSGRIYAQRTDKETGVTLGMDEVLGTVTTVLGGAEKAILNTDEFSNSLPRPIGARSAPQSPR